MKYQKQLSVNSFHITRYGNLSTSFMFYQMQEIAGEHAISLGFGYDDLQEESLFWVLSRLLVKINRRPTWREEFQLNTWSRGTDGFYGYRDFEFLDQEGKHLILATSSWLALDTKTKRIKKLDTLNKVTAYKESLFGKNAKKIKSPIIDDYPEFSPVVFNEIDINQHFNSGRYIERIIDSYTFKFHEKNELKEFEINFLKEGLHSDSLAVIKQVTGPNEHFCSVIRESDKSELIKARLIWGERITKD